MERTAWTTVCGVVVSTYNPRWCYIQGKPGGMRYSYSCGCATGIRDYLFNTLGGEGLGLCECASFRILCFLLLAFTRYGFTLKLLCTSESSFFCPSPSALPALLHYYCTTIAQYMTPPQPPFCMPYTIQYW